MLREIHANKLKQRRKGLPDVPVLIPQKFVVIPGYKPEPTPPPKDNENIQNAPKSPTRSKENISTVSASPPSIAHTATVTREIAATSATAASPLTIPLEINILNKSTETRRTSFRVQPSLARQRREPSVAAPITPQKRQFDVEESEKIAIQSSTLVQLTQTTTTLLAERNIEEKFAASSSITSPVRSTSQLDQEQTLQQPSSPVRSVRSAASRESSIKLPQTIQSPSKSIEDNVDHGVFAQGSPTLREDIVMTDENEIDSKEIKKSKETEAHSEQVLTLQAENIQYLTSKKVQEETAASAAEEQIETDTAPQDQEKDHETASTPEKFTAQQNEKDSVAQEVAAEEEIEEEMPTTEEIATEEKAADIKVTTVLETEEAALEKETAVEEENSTIEEAAVEEESAVIRQSATIEEDVDMIDAAQDNQDEDTGLRDTASTTKEKSPPATIEQQEEREEETATTEIQSVHADSRENSLVASTPKEMSPTHSEREKSPQAVTKDQEGSHADDNAQPQPQKEEEADRLSPIPGMMDIDMDDPIEYNYNNYGDEDNDQGEHNTSLDDEIAQKRQAIQEEFGDLDEDEVAELIKDLEERSTITPRFKVIKLANLHLEALNMITTEAMVEAKRSFNDPFATSISGDYHGKVISAYSKRHQAYLEYIRYSSGLDRLKKIEKEYNTKKFQTEVERRQVKKESDQLREEIAALDAEKQELIDLDDFLGSVRAML